MASSAIFAKAAEHWQYMKQDYISFVDYQYLAAVEATAGVLVNHEGRAKHIDGFTLFSGPLSRAQKYASEELLEFWESNRRYTLSQFEDQWVQGRLEYQ